MPLFLKSILQKSLDVIILLCYSNRCYKIILVSINMALFRYWQVGDFGKLTRKATLPTDDAASRSSF
jgi:hypothetical protein